MSSRHVKPIYFGSHLAAELDETSENIYQEHIWSVFFLLEKCKKINPDTMECQEFPRLNVSDLHGHFLVVSFDLPPSLICWPKALSYRRYLLTRPFWGFNVQEYVFITEGKTILSISDSVTTKIIAYEVLWHRQVKTVKDTLFMS